MTVSFKVFGCFLKGGLHLAVVGLKCGGGLLPWPPPEETEIPVKLDNGDGLMLEADCCRGFTKVILFFAAGELLRLLEIMAGR